MNSVKSSILISLVLFSACASGGHLMTSETFYDIPIGATKQEVVAQAGEPYKISKKEDGIEEIEYVERLKIGARTVQETRYILTVKEGKISSKRVEVSSPSPANFDSYEMQTTQKNS